MVTVDRPDNQYTADFIIAQGDTEPPITAELDAAAGGDEDLSGDTVKFQMSKPSADSLTIDAVAAIDDAQTGLVSYNWQDGDTDEVGYYNAKWVVDNGGTGTYNESFPSDGFLTVQIFKDLP